MSLTTLSNKVIHGGNGVATSFAYTFPILEATHLVVIYTNTAGAETTLDPTLYSVTGIGGLNGGAVTYPLSGSPIAQNTLLTIMRLVPLTQTTVFANQGGYYPEVVEGRFDRAFMGLQQLQEQIDRFELDPSSQELPVAVGTRAALRVLTSSPAAVVVKYNTSISDGWGGVFMLDPDDTSTADDGALTIVTAGGKRYKRIYSRGAVNAEWFGALGDDSTDNATAIANAVTALGPYSSGTVTDGGTLRFGPGIFRVASTIDITEKHGLVIEGAGPLATEIKGTGDFKVIKLEGATSSNVTNKVGIRNLSIRGAGKANTAAHGISTKWTNRCFVEDVMLFGCRNALNLFHNWQLKLDNVHPHGSGSDQNYMGFYLGESTLAAIDNAVIANGCQAQGCEHAGFRIINGQGSKFTSCEAGDTAYGWYIGDPVVGTVTCQWINFVNCLGDTCTTQNWFFKRGSATAMSEMIVTGTWTGNSTGAGIQIENGTDIQVNGVISITTQTEAVKIVGGSRISISDVSARQYNNANAGHAAVKLEDSSSCSVMNVRETSTNARSSVTETGTSDLNLLIGLSGAPTLLGASTLYVGSNSTYGWQVRNTADAAGAIIGGAASTAYLGLGTSANPLLHTIKRISGGDIEVDTNGTRRWQFGDGTGETGFVNTSDVPIQLYRYATVAGLPAWTTPGRVAWVDNGRRSGEGAGVGTGCVIVSTAAGTWDAVWSGLAVTA